MSDASQGGNWDGPAYDEAFDKNGRPRAAYASLAQRLRWDPLHPPGSVVHRLSGQPLGDDHRVLPVPLALDDAEYRSTIQAGLKQRARALQMFFADVFLGEGKYFRSESELTRPLLDEILLSEGTSLDELRRWWNGHSLDDIRFVYGPDLVREPSGRWCVLEDNVGCVGGCADSFYVFEAYKNAASLPSDDTYHPDLATAVSRWLETLGISPHSSGVVAMLSDGEYLDVYLPIRFEEDDRRKRLVEQIGVHVVDNEKFEQLLEGAATAPINAVVNIGVPSRKAWSLLLDVVFGRLKAPILNAPGTSVLGNKALLPFVSDMINFYCREEPILWDPPTMHLRDGLLPPDPKRWVVKTATGCQGSEVFILQSLSPSDLEKISTAIRDTWPRQAAVAQRHIQLSQLWTVSPVGAQCYSVEVRALAYVLGWRNVFAGEQALGKLVPRDKADSLNNIARGGSYVPIVREVLTEKAQI
jgi:uncharacterized circularly permuted ATP-grasp superfamily protein